VDFFDAAVIWNGICARAIVNGLPATMECLMPMDASRLKELSPALEKIASLLRPEEINLRQEFDEGSVFTPYLTAFLMILQRLRGNASLEAAVTELKENPAWANSHPTLATGELSSNSGAYSRARKRLKTQVAEDFADRVFQTLQSTAPPSWQGRRVFMVDGTTLSLTSSDVLRKAFPPASNQYGRSVWPILHCVVAHDLASGCALRPETGAMYGSKAAGEVSLALKLLPRIPPQSVLLADRNFGVFGFVHAAHQAGHDTVTRLTKSRFEALIRKARRIDPQQWELDWKPTAADRRTHPSLPADAQVKISIHAVPTQDAEGKDFTLWIATTLEVPGEALGEFYRLRQNVETDIRDVKVSLKMSQLRGRSAEMLSKELALGMVAYNLVVQIRRLAAARGDIQPRRLSFTGSWTLVNSLILRPRKKSLEAYVAQFEEVLRGCLQRKLPNRPGRKYPHEQLPRGRKFPDRKPIPLV
jgi:hypothetical protein